jgi:imidazolonepropionase-like amidohydrolase
MRSVFLVSITLLLHSTASWTANAQAITFRNAEILDGTGRGIYRGSVVVEGGRIRAVGPDVTTAGTIIDASGKVLMPGLFDVHTHLPYSSVAGARSDWGKNLAAYLLSGVTTVADFGTYGETFAAMRALLADGIVKGPHILFAQRFTSPGGHGAEGGRPDIFSLEAQTPREARVAVQKASVYKPDVLKVFTDGWRYDAAPEMSSMDEETLCALVDEAHKNSLKVLTHTVTLRRAKEAARCKVDVIAHSIGDQVADTEVIDLMKKNGTAYAPTLAVYETRPRDTRTPLLERVLEPSAYARLPRPGAGGRRSETQLRRWKVNNESVAALFKGGVLVASGTDAGVTGTHHGWATVREAMLLRNAGLTAMEAIQAVTLNSAKAVGLENDRGSIEVGKRADLILIDGRPHERIEDLEKVDTVVLDGKIVDLASLAALVKSTEPIRIPAKPVVALLDDLESADGTTKAGSRWVNSSDGGHDRSRVVFTRTLRKPGNHALSAIAKMGEKDRPYVRLNLPLQAGGIVPGDLERYKGVEFEVRGEGTYRVLAVPRIADGGAPAVSFSAEGKWRKVKIEFSKFEPSLPRGEIVQFGFELARKAGEAAWIELDNIKLY